MNHKRLQSLLVSPDSTLREAMQCIDRGSCGIALVVDAERRLLGTITDGDMRRAVLAGTDLELSVRELLARKHHTPYASPVTARPGDQREKLLETLHQNALRQLPVVDEQGRVADLVLLDDLLPTQALPLQAVIMAGGMGVRLRPLTEDLPKPMLPVGGKPLLERVIRQLQQVGIRRVNVTTHYKPEKISDYFGDGSAYGVELRYVNEDRPLGTGGALGLMEAPTEPILVINGDVLTQIDFRAMLDYHRRHQADMTVAVRHYDIKIPYGVVECQGTRVAALKEKPQLQVLVNAGIYLLEPGVHELMPHGEPFNMTDLIQRLLADGHTVISFPVIEYWLDIGHLVDYERAQEMACRESQQEDAN